MRLTLLYVSICLSLAVAACQEPPRTPSTSATPRPTTVVAGTPLQPPPVGGVTTPTSEDPPPIVEAVPVPTPDFSAPTTTPIPGGLPTPGTAQDPMQLCRALASNFPEDRSRQQGTDVVISLVTALGDRFQAAGLAMQVLRDAPSTEVVQCGSQVALDVLVGRTGRHTAASAYSPGTLPADRTEMADPGLAMTIHEITPHQRVKDIVSSVFIGDVSRWRQPSQRWDDIDAAVGRGNAGVSAQDGRLMRLVGWALLARQASSVSAANEIGRAGVADAAAGVQAAKEAFDFLCTQTQDGRCPE